MELGVLEVLRIILGLVLIFFLPGYLLVKALFPGRNELDKEYNLIYEIGLGMGLSIVIAILDGFFLGSLHQLVGFRLVDGTEKGYFDTPYIVSSLLVICLLLFVAGWYRGAFPWMGRLHPSLTRVPASEGPKARKERIDNLIKELWDLSRERERLRREVRDFEHKSRAHGAGMKVHYRKRLEESRKQLAEVDRKMKELEDKRAEELAGVEEERDRRRKEKERRREARSWYGKKNEPASEGDGRPTGETTGEKLAEEEFPAPSPEKDAGPPVEPPLPEAEKPPAPLPPPLNPLDGPSEKAPDKLVEGEEE
jgi:hypothetical protein